MRRADPLSELEELYREGFARFLRVARAVTGDRETARDAVQDGFYKAIRQRRSFRGRGPLEAWVWRIVLNEARRARRRPVELAFAPEPGYEIVANGNGHSGDEDEQLRVAVAALPERQRLVLFLRYYADLDYAAIALALGIERGTVSATLSSAHATLRRVLTEVPT
ncbi:sigma-70 family RNA polymerase sigma factor [Gaiella sp.]|jgi:RNA polymerase sigma-70 factor (ECF subfamily)|uniref:RNA polymerase sigma factor n=1 Tax=Gaiella sp. TaxID=2663207 RepID=UPI002E32EC5F|nr:sigma-70 family RNA polymerase sigma factor [Gaiella sp.]HEX5584806.1 sigma-70 family RNA polymerase sigma factor [Gaiella sp.]